MSNEEIKMEVPETDTPVKEESARISTAEALRAIMLNLHLGFVLRFFRWFGSLRPVAWGLRKKPLRWVFSLKTLKWASIVIVSLVLLVVLIFSIWNWRASDRLAEKLKEITAKEQLVTPENLNEYVQSERKKLGENNGARYYQAAFKIMPEKDYSDEDTFEQSLPYVGKGRKPVLGENVSQGMSSDIETYLSRYDGVFPIIDKALQTEKTLFDLDYTEGAGMLLPHIAKFRNLSRLTVLRDYAALSKGDQPAAFGHLLDSFKLTGALNNDFTLISELVRVAMVTIAFENFEYHLSVSPLNREQLDELQHTLKDIDDTDFYEPYLGERSMGIWAFNSLLSDEIRASEMMGYGHSGLRFANYFRGSLKDQFVRYLDVMTDAIKSTRLPLREAIVEFPEKFEKIETEWREGGILYRMNNFVLAMLFPVMTKAFDNQIEAHQRNLIAQTVCAVEKYRKDIETIPETLDALVPKYLKEVPEDYFSDGKIQYIKGDDGYIIASVGKNRKAELNETIDAKAQGKTNVNNTLDDIVFRVIK